LANVQTVGKRRTGPQRLEKKKTDVDSRLAIGAEVRQLGGWSSLFFGGNIFAPDDWVERGRRAQAFAVFFGRVACGVERG
jgi:hypothetical protein